jgi:hypothetical protein
MTIGGNLMTFSKRVFAGAGIWGLLIVFPLYFLFDQIGQLYPPAITHPDFFYGFIAVTLAWQIAFLAIASDPGRFRLFMLPAVVEKVGYVFTLVVLYAQRRLTMSQLAVGVPDLGLGALFIIAFFRTVPTPTA